YTGQATPAYGIFEKTDRRQTTEDTYYSDEWTRRKSSARTFNLTLTFEHEDKVQMLVDPKSTYVKAMSMAMKRAYDRLIIEACFADVTEVDVDGTESQVVFPTGRTVGDGTSPISFDAVTEINEVFMTSEVMLDVPKVAIIGPTQVRKLMQLTEQTSQDYVSAQALQKLSTYGIVPNWLGYTWIVSNWLEGDVPGTDIKCIFMSKEAVGLVVNMEMLVRITENPSMQYMWQCFNQFTSHAARIQDEHIVMGHFADTL
ncbi:MAG: hypothetical protein KAS32_29045, partial [Candidatus Peribacteraceae bacterium]|nr:hypothetical protein [Candidatus Peribacteraceae bacterium]